MINKLIESYMQQKEKKKRNLTPLIGWMMDVKVFEQNPLKRNSIATGFRNTMMQVDFKIYIKKKERENFY